MCVTLFKEAYAQNQNKTEKLVIKNRKHKKRTKNSVPFAHGGQKQTNQF